MSLSAAGDHASLPIAYRLYLPPEWADDPERRARAGVPDDIVFQTKPRIALDQLRAARAAGIEAELVLADAGYGNDTDFRDGITEIGLTYAVGIQSSTTLWPPGVEPLPPKQWSGRGRPASAIRRDAEHQPVSAKQLALELPKQAWRRSLGVKGPTPSSHRASQPYVSDLPIVIINGPRCVGRNGA